MRSTTAIVAITAVVAVAAIAVTISRTSVDGGPTQLAPAGIVVTPPAVGDGTSPEPVHAGTTEQPSPTAPRPGAAPTTIPEPAAGDAEPPLQTVAPAPARTLPAQAATGKPSSPGKSGDHASH